jgi:2-polyprenyl-6-methoxyphenol hydroxylase-like FAD-dependent oxidoreductase
MRSEADVVVAGAGPVGLMLAIELKRRGIEPLLVEKRQEPSYFVKALGITPRMLEIWDQVGLLEEALAAGIFLRGTTALRNGVEIESQDVPLQGQGYGFFVLAQYEVERMLRTALARLGGRIEWGVTLGSVEDRGDRVVVTLQRDDGSESGAECRYLAGCDGAHSIVRHSLGLDYEGEAMPMTFMLGDVCVDGPLPRGRAYRGLHFEDGQMVNQVAAIPIPGDPRRYRLSMAAPTACWEESADLTTPPSLDQIAAAAGPAFPPGMVLSNLRWSSFYRVSHRIVSRYAQGRCFLAGDAAHIHPPIGGQGMNTGLQDVFNLGWKLALAVTGRASPDLLESYDAERRPVGLAVVTRTSGRMAKAIEGEDSGETDAQMRDDSQLFVDYRDSRWVARDARVAVDALVGPRPGDRAPEVGSLRRAYVDAAARLLDLLRHPGHTLLFYADETTDESHYRVFANVADELRQRCGDAIACQGIAAPAAQRIELERFPWSTDAEGRFRSAFHSVGGSLELIRPDGYLGYRAPSTEPSSLITYLGRIFALSDGGSSSRGPLGS